MCWDRVPFFIAYAVRIASMILSTAGFLCGVYAEPALTRPLQDCSPIETCQSLWRTHLIRGSQGLWIPLWMAWSALWQAKPPKKVGQGDRTPWETSLARLHAVPFFSLSNWETGASEVGDRARDWSERGRRPRGGWGRGQRTRSLQSLNYCERERKGLRAVYSVYSIVDVQSIASSLWRSLGSLSAITEHLTNIVDVSRSQKYFSFSALSFRPSPARERSAATDQLWVDNPAFHRTRRCSPPSALRASYERHRGNTFWRHFRWSAFVAMAT